MTKTKYQSNFGVTLKRISHLKCSFLLQNQWHKTFIESSTIDILTILTMIEMKLKNNITYNTSKGRENISQVI